MATVDSVTKQHRIDLMREVVLINDGSTDNTHQVVNKLKNQHPELDIIILNNNERKFAAYSRNRGLEQCTGDLVCFLDSDVIIPPDYLVQHAWQHQYEGKCITFSLRSNVRDINHAIFPVHETRGEFRWCMMQEYGNLNGQPFSFCKTHTLAEMCLTCAVTYRRNDLLEVKGCPENFIGWGFNDTAMAAKVIALGASVIPILNSTVYHLEHTPRSGHTSRKWTEFSENKKRYQRMLKMPAAQTFQYYIEALDDGADVAPTSYQPLNKNNK